jgi:hypothetical protein
MVIEPSAESADHKTSDNEDDHSSWDGIETSHDEVINTPFDCK